MEQETKFAVPYPGGILGAVVVQLTDPFNLLVLVTEGDQINWKAVLEIKDDICRIATTDLLGSITRSQGSSAYTYRCCDYSLGVILGCLEMLGKKKFVNSVIPVDFPSDSFTGSSVRAYDFI